MKGSPLYIVANEEAELGLENEKMDQYTLVILCISCINACKNSVTTFVMPLVRWYVVVELDSVVTFCEEADFTNKNSSTTAMKVQGTDVYATDVSALEPGTMLDDTI